MKKEVRLEISGAIKLQLEKMPKWKAMFYLQEHGETSAYKMAKDLKWSTGKTHAVLNTLKESNAVATKVELINGRATKFAKLKD
jgi:hypothetical protein